MSRTLTISDELYAQLEIMTRKRGLKSIEQLLEEWQTNEDELLQRRSVVNQIDELRESLFAKYGEMSDSVELIREDRVR
jgi:hypothetical protein